MMNNCRRLLKIAITVVMAVSALGMAQAKGTPEEQLLQAENARFAAMVKGDVAALDKLLGPELSYTHSNALVQDKAALLGDFKSGAIKYLSIEPSDMKARVFGNMAIVTGGAAVHVIQNGNDLNIKIRYTNTHINRAGSWQMIAWQATRLPQ